MQVVHIVTTAPLKVNVCVEKTPQHLCVFYKVQKSRIRIAGLNITATTTINTVTTATATATTNIFIRSNCISLTAFSHSVLTSPSVLKPPDFTVTYEQHAYFVFHTYMFRLKFVCVREFIYFTFIDLLITCEYIFLGSVII